MTEDEYNRICNKLEMADLPLDQTYIRKVWKESLKAKQYTKVI